MSVRSEEIKRFAQLSHLWWDPLGPYKLLHRMNPARIGFMRQFFGPGPLPFENKRIIDVGCGGGFLSEPLCRLGGNVLGIDATLENIQVARQHSRLPIEYRHTTAEEIDEQFDLVVALEILEHVKDPQAFVETLKRLCKPQGHIFISTINRTHLSQLLTITLAQDVFGWVPKHTHTHSQYITPQELTSWTRDLTHLDTKGIQLNPLTQEWSIGGPVWMNYICAFQKP
ncbi:S-adenosyl-L-methionine-dependent methyltransferase [Gorgonomyces haynaldii]|nr:S-adenosyl-L-methionine-dependent methyltransferase [Gorgonomyces haynaldii]